MPWPLNRRGETVVQCSHGFSRFESAVNDYEKFDVGTKNAILRASSSVVSLRSRIGNKVVYIGSGTIIDCVGHDESFSATILTSATFLQGPAGNYSIIPNLEIDVYLSSGKLCKGQILNHDFHYNIAIINIKSDTVLATARLRCVDDSIAIDSRTSALADAKLLHGDEETRYNLFPGELVIALARYSETPHEIMAAPGFFSCDNFPHKCKELLWTTCTVNKATVGGPVINCYGEVIGVSFIICPFNPFLPINLALKCLKDLKKKRQVPRPWLGACVANLYTAKLEKLDELARTFPHVIRGAVVEQTKKMRFRACVKRTKVCHSTFWSVRNWLKARVLLEKIKKKKRIQTRDRPLKIKKKKRIQTRDRKMKIKRSPASSAGLHRDDVNIICDGNSVGSPLEIKRSPARSAGLRRDDVIIRCDGNSVGSPLELTEALWDKEGKPVELIVMRPGTGQLKLTVTVGTYPKMNRWHVPHVYLEKIDI
ncbi:putative protease Do-like 14 isoform X1 [Apium graveolens]|uniref:putative protease Do-like 14 isoform X1 n=1 Tax=Apium graveolens TaxID=4045 RepID=UPI003D7AEE8E